MPTSGRLSAVGTLAAALTLAACSSTGPSTPAVTGRPVAVPSAAVATVLDAKPVGRLGTVLASAGGATLYVNADEPARADACDTECRRTWPLVLAPAGARPTAGPGVQSSLITTLSVGGVSAVAYAGHPLHSYVGDPQPGDAFGQGIQGVWSAVTVSGRAATGSP